MFCIGIKDLKHFYDWISIRKTFLYLSSCFFIEFLYTFQKIINVRHSLLVFTRWQTWCYLGNLLVMKDQYPEVVWASSKTPLCNSLRIPYRLPQNLNADNVLTLLYSETSNSTLWTLVEQNQGTKNITSRLDFSFFFSVTRRIIISLWNHLKILH